ncbi:MAG: TIGR04076 family protein [Chloroflexi bacterium]|nr:TIGR04076 family protein [Chloroflexota bacterium]
MPRRSCAVICWRRRYKQTDLSGVYGEFKRVNQVKLTITKSACRAGIHRPGQAFIVGDICPPICHELWQCIYPSVYALLNGASLEVGEGRASCFEVRCPDQGRVLIRGEVIGCEDQVKGTSGQDGPSFK